tara:strand:- start:6546 stop:7223 length:678 start_codon:yes stop_codon:yes gene_type:complete
MIEKSMDLNIQSTLIQFVPFMAAVIFHEYAHGAAAYYWGDSTAKDHGRMTLNPGPHIDIIGTIVFPLIVMLTGMNVLFGWAKPVPINPSRFRKYRPGLFWVSFAGPGMNFTLAVFSAAVFSALIRFLDPSFYLYEPLISMTRFSVVINVALGIFNLLPLPPLDGSKMIESFLSYEATRKYEQLAQYSFFILMALIFTGALRVLSYPIIFLSQSILYLMGSLFGIL